MISAMDAEVIRSGFPTAFRTCYKVQLFSAICTEFIGHKNAFTAVYAFFNV